MRIAGNGAKDDILSLAFLLYGQEELYLGEILSVGIDIGTATTSIVISRLRVEDTSDGFTIPHMSIVEKEVLYKSPIYFTPMESGSRINSEELENIVRKEYEKAGIDKTMIDTGAVIITGESAKKENAASVSHALSDFSGDFVVATAGPDMESAISGKGAGIQQYSKERMCSVVNMDIGGGTSNISIFSQGELIGRACLDIGGRVIQYDDEFIVRETGSKIKELAEECGIYIEKGKKTDPSDIKTLAKRMADILYSAVRAIDEGGDEQIEACMKYKTEGSSAISFFGKIDCISFSGGVGECVYSDKDDPYEYGDAGVFLARAIKSGKLADYKIIKPKETIRATVIGAGSYTTEISGSTITCTQENFPLKNIPVLAVDDEAEQECLKGNAALLKEKAKWFFKQTDADDIAFLFKGDRRISYDKLCNMGRCIADTASVCLREERALIVITKEDIAKALGRIIRKRSEDARKIICIDAVKAEKGDYIDLGTPMMDGRVMPVIVKTLIYGSDDRRKM